MKQTWSGWRVFLIPTAAWIGGMAVLPPAMGAAASKKPEAPKIVVDEKSVAQVAAMLTEKPVLFGKPATDRTAWEALAKRDSYKDVIGKAEKLLTQPLTPMTDEDFLDYSRTGSRSKFSRASGARRGRIEPLVIAECLENKGRFIPAFETLVRSLCEEKTWLMSCHDGSLKNFHGETVDIDLGSSALSWHLAEAYYLLGDKLSPEVRQLLRDNCRRRTLDPFRDVLTGKRKPIGWMNGTNNWGAVCLAGITGTALAVAEPREERAFFVVGAEECSKRFLSGFTSDGYCSEGLGYWNYGFGHYLALSEEILQSTRGGEDLMAREEVRAPATFGARIGIAGGVYPAFADCSITAKPDARAMWYVSRRYGLGMRAWEDKDVVSPSGGLAEAMMFSFPNSASKCALADKAAEGPGVRDWFDKAGILICRPAERSKCEMGVALKGGNNAEHHNHNDVGSFVVVVGGHALLLDPGSEEYTARTFSSKRYESKVLNSYGHPVPVVAGQLQKTGAEARARVVRTDFTDKADTLVLDIKSCYDAVKDLEKLERTFVYSRDGAGTLTVTDVVDFSGPEPFATALITYGQWKQLGQGAVLIFDGHRAVRVDIEATANGPTAGSQVAAPFEIKAEEIHEKVKAPNLPVRLGVSLKSPVKSAMIAMKIAPPALPKEAAAGEALRNGGFEDGAAGWTILKDGMGAVTDEKAASGKFSLKIKDTSKEEGSNISSAPVVARAGAGYELRGKYFAVSGGDKGLGMYVKFLDKDQRVINKANEKGHIEAVGSLGGSASKWAPFAFAFKAPAGTEFMQVWIHSITSAQVEGYLDDLEIVKR